jgi:3-oxocholest-4-en-26-oate---CoA ligase
MAQRALRACESVLGLLTPIGTAPTIGCVSYNLAELFERIADAVPEREAVVTPARRCSYAQLDDRATRLAHAFAARGIGAGDHVGLQLYNGVEYLEAMLAAFKVGRSR